MTAASDAINAAPHPRDRSMESWRGRKAVLASRGETTGPRVDEADAALAWWRNRKTLLNMGIPADEAEALLDQIDKRANAAEPSETVVA